MLLLLLLAADNQLFTQASLLRLREVPNAKGKVVRELPIGSACAQTGPLADGWIEVDCAGAKGFAKADLFGAKAPDRESLLSAMRGPGSNKDKLTAAGRVLALAALTRGDGDSEMLWDAREQYRALFYTAEIERLTEARSKGDTLKTPKVVSDPCEGKELDCIAQLAGKTHALEADWLHVDKRGDDFVYAAILRDSDIYVATGRYLKPTLTIELTYKSPIDQPAVLALTEKQTLSGCYAPVVIDEKGGCEFQFDQNCSPDNCWDPFQSCKQSVSSSCLDCTQACTDSCLSCRTLCKGKAAKCLSDCGTKAEGCGSLCAAQKGRATAGCDKTYKGCSDKEDRWWKKNCEANCNAYRACTSKGGSNCPIKQECNTRCMF